MRTVSEPAELADAVASARSEAMTAFGDPSVYLERRLARPRHVEVQLLGDQHGTVCRSSSANVRFSGVTRRSSKRRHRSAVSPACGVAMTSAAAAVARAVGYTNAGTIEFLLDERRPVLLPRDEHPTAGRTSDNRDGDRHRSRAMADPNRAR